MTEHIIKRYDDELQRLTGEIFAMGELAVRQIEAAVDVVERRDDKAAERVVDNDDAIDAMERAIDQDVVRLLALRSPMARDLREVLAAVRVSSDIERIGDHAAGIAKRSIPLSMLASVPSVRTLHSLAALACEAVRKVLVAWRDHDADQARAVWVDDDRIDDAWSAMFRELLTYMMEDPRSITACAHLLFMAKNIERIGDHATNIAENVWYVVHGTSLQAAVDAAARSD